MGALSVSLFRICDRFTHPDDNVAPRALETQSVAWLARCGNTRAGALYNLHDDPGELQNLYDIPKCASQRRVMNGFASETMVTAQDRTAPQTRA